MHGTEEQRHGGFNSENELERQVHIVLGCMIQYPDTRKSAAAAAANDDDDDDDDDALAQKFLPGFAAE